MTITKLQYGKRDSERVNVYLDGEFAFAVEQSTLLDFSLHSGKEVAEGLVEQIVRQDAVLYYSRRMLAWCMQRPRNARELKQKIHLLISKRAGQKYELDESVIYPEVMQKLSAQGFDDAHFAQWFAAERARQQKYGRRRVLFELKSKGVDSAVAEAAIAQSFGDETELTKQLLTKKFGVEALAEISDYKQRSKAYRFLKSRGF